MGRPRGNCAAIRGFLARVLQFPMDRSVAIMCVLRLPALPLLLLLVPASAFAGEAVTLNERSLIRLQGGVRTALNLPLPLEDRSLPIVADEVGGEAADVLRALEADGRAQGFSGILYDNRDRGHSRLDPARFPRLAWLAYGAELVAEGVDFGLAGGIVLPAVVLGNSSTAITRGPFPRSLPRLAMTTRGLPDVHARLYRANHLYVYPEHRDHDEVDLFPANWPYMIVSQGSSGSDRPFLEAIAMTLAAFPPDTFARLRDEDLVAPTVQMILRRHLSGVDSEVDYATGLAHPVVFDAALLRPERMVAAAAAMTPESIPPMVRITVIEEDFSASAGLASMDERLFDTPSAIARIWRDFGWEREMTVSAAATSDPNGRALSFSWRLLGGVAERVEITPLDPEGRRARLRVTWHDAFTTERPDGPRETSRVDIGVFAHNGVTDSAPAIISISFPTHQQRDYAPSGDGTMGLQSIDYDAIGRGASYDPVLHWSAPWSDAPLRDSAGRIVAWQRTARDGGTTVVPHARDEDVAGMAYRIDRTQPRLPVLEEVDPR